MFIWYTCDGFCLFYLSSQVLLFTITVWSCVTLKIYNSRFLCLYRVMLIFLSTRGSKCFVTDSRSSRELKRIVFTQVSCGGFYCCFSILSSCSLACTRLLTTPDTQNRIVFVFLMQTFNPQPFCTFFILHSSWWFIEMRWNPALNCMIFFLLWSEVRETKALVEGHLRQYDGARREKCN